MENINFVAIDFETATSERSSVCEVGISIVEAGNVINTKSWLVKPLGNEYDDFNIWIHGITPNDTKDSPEFPSIWKELLPFINDKILIAHNAAFDMYVLRDVLDLYELEYPNLKTLCSYRLSKNILPGLYSYNLHSVCHNLNIQLDNHHRAADDAEACAKVCLKCLEKESISDFMQLEEKHRMIPGVMNHNERNYSGPFTKRKSQETKLDAKLITGDPLKHNPESIFYHQYVVFTGTLKAMERKKAMLILADTGGIPENRITQNTNYLVVGQQNFKVVGESGMSGKQKEVVQRLKNGQEIEIISEEDFLQNI
jgi:DNA polymerase-3 subunit epsilon